MEALREQPKFPGRHLEVALFSDRLQATQPDMDIKTVQDQHCSSTGYLQATTNPQTLQLLFPRSIPSAHLPILAHSPMQVFKALREHTDQYLEQHLSICLHISFMFKFLLNPSSADMEAIIKAYFLVKKTSVSWKVRKKSHKNNAFRLLEDMNMLDGTCVTTVQCHCHTHHSTHSTQLPLNLHQHLHSELPIQYNSYKFPFPSTNQYNSDLQTLIQADLQMWIRKPASIAEKFGAHPELI